ncbi:hypothetical protein JHN63_31425 [Streptomyces sp. MBT65]|uniref:hypothetical protein n=1 Tax=Streptomyces sp. MBT65 TaxID=1488395 RepID=UPI00190961CE|nr:hypothetical protein [Streptomyces sp. MBT65]MBK3578237.1 hypothetical protein [Streptomyces sp. MBT65]
MAETTTIRVSRQARDHLARVAEDRGVSVRQLVEQLAAEQLTWEQAAERMAAARKESRERMGGRPLCDEHFANGPAAPGSAVTGGPVQADPAPNRLGPEPRWNSSAGQLRVPLRPPPQQPIVHVCDAPLSLAFAL